MARRMMGCVIAALLVLLEFPVAACAQNDEARAIAWQGVERHYVVHRPPGATGRMPLVVALGGLGADLKSVREWLPIDPVADQAGFAIAYPEPIGGRWSYWRGGGVFLPDRPGEEADDAGFIVAVVRNLVDSGLADPARIYLTGMSRGALMSWTLACEHADLFAAVAPLSSGMTERQAASCHPARPIPIIAVDGTDDPVQFYDGFVHSPLPRLLSVPETMAFWWHANGCREETVTRLPHLHRDDPTHVALLQWTGCANGVPTMLYRVSGGGHMPPSLRPRDNLEEIMGRRNRDMETAETIGKAFSGIVR